MNLSKLKLLFSLKGNLVMNIRNIVYALVALLIISCSKDEEPKPSPAQFSIDQSTVDFGEVEIPTQKEVKLTITNTGDEDLVLKDYSFSGPNASEFSFNASETEETVQAGETYEFLTIFKPAEEGDKTAILTILSNIGEHKVNVSGSAILGPNAIVNIPDANFKASLMAHGIDTNDDGEIQISEAEAYEETIVCDNKGITDLTGIEAFVNTTGLNVASNLLSQLDISNNIALVELNVDYNSLTSLDVSKNVALQTLRCTDNELTGLDITQNVNLNSLTCKNNQLTSLDVSKNILLDYLYCFENQITSLDISQNKSIRVLNCSSNKLTALNVANGNNHNMIFMSALYNSGLTCIQIDSGFTPHSDWKKDSTATFSTTACP